VAYRVKSLLITTPVKGADRDCGHTSHSSLGY
jgi:hypothetical protein